MKLRSVFLARYILCAALVVACILLVQSATWAETLTAAAAPASGLAGTTSYLSGTGFPSGTITGGTVTLSSGSCGGTVAGTAPVTAVANEGILRRFAFVLPSLPTGTYYASVSGTAGSTAFSTVGTSCSTIAITTTSTTLAACVPTSSLAVTAGTNVDAFIPFGSWGGSTTGIERVPLEGTDTAMNFATPGAVNSCASNSVTGEVVCTENTTNVDLINGTTLTTITSGSNAFAEFSGGDCQNCGVGINAANNTAIIAMGVAGGSGGEFGGGAGLQVLNLGTTPPTFNAAVPTAHYVSEDISIDSGRNLVLSPSEDGFYDLLKIGTGNTLTEYGNDIYPSFAPLPYLDSAAEDCTTGIALASDEDSDGVYITDLTQATFTAGSPGTWSAPQQFVNLSDDGYSAGTCGISSAPGTGHLAVVTGEFGGSSYSALQLPSTSGSGTPNLTDWAYVEFMPNTPNGSSFSAGFDPHTVTAYTSPNTSKSYAVFADWATTPVDYVGVVDLACVLALPRNAGTHSVTSAALTGTGPGTVSSCTRYVAVP